jgi:hypothetical protein
MAVSARAQASDMLARLREWRVRTGRRRLLRPLWSNARMAEKQSFYFISACILCLATCGSRANRNAGTKTLGNIALNPYKQAIFLHQWVIKNLLVQYGIGAT